MTYRNNPKAWVLTTIFQDWLQEYNREIAKKHGNQYALLLLDNCSSHYRKFSQWMLESLCLLKDIIAVTY
jgi:hypothetical protein